MSNCTKSSLSYVQPLNIMGSCHLATHWLWDIRKNPNVLRLLCVLVWSQCGCSHDPGWPGGGNVLHFPGNWVISLGSPVNLWSDNHYFSLWGILLTVHSTQYSCTGLNQNNIKNAERNSYRQLIDTHIANAKPESNGILSRLSPSWGMNAVLLTDLTWTGIFSGVSFLSDKPSELSLQCSPQSVSMAMGQPT